VELPILPRHFLLLSPGFILGLQSEIFHHLASIKYFLLFSQGMDFLKPAAQQTIVLHHSSFLSHFEIISQKVNYCAIKRSQRYFHCRTVHSTKERSGNVAYLNFLPQSTNTTRSHAEHPIKHKPHLNMDTTLYLYKHWSGHCVRYMYM